MHRKCMDTWRGYKRVCTSKTGRRSAGSAAVAAAENTFPFDHPRPPSLLYVSALASFASKVPKNP